MHLRSSQVRGIPVIHDGTQQIAGFLHSPLIDPDTGRIIGFFVLSAFAGSGELFLQSPDIVAWGTRVHIRSEDCLSPPNELIRLKNALSDPRRVIGQRIRTKDTKRNLGICSDVQFNTRHLIAEWIFPWKYFIARQPLPLSDILEVTPEAVWVRDPIRPISVEVPKEKDSEVVLPVRPDVVPAAQTRRRL